MTLTPCNTECGFLLLGSLITANWMVTAAHCVELALEDKQHEQCMIDTLANGFYVEKR